jgi:hypothetical protein
MLMGTCQEKPENILSFEVLHIERDEGDDAVYEEGTAGAGEGRWTLGLHPFYLRPLGNVRL